ncbi:MAG TPA: hypothetical protein VJZ00_24955 [Thermoanaerobaculia bacterium]|nr:hypothetical protein [Thermoanaerobaculia bacterium]
MWVYDGEEWTQDDGSEKSTVIKSETPRPRWDEMMPELQVIEIVVPVPRNRNVPPLPMP